MKWKNNILLFCLAAPVVTLMLLLEGCTKEDMENCGITLSFRYIKNNTGLDKFSTDVQQIDLYIFDEDGFYIDTYTLKGDELKTNNILLKSLKPGTYTLVAWGNITDQLNITNFANAPTTTVSQGSLSLKNQSGQVESTSCPPALFHGIASQYKVEANAGRQHLTIDLTKFSNHIRVIQKGLPFSPGSMPYACTIVSQNGHYRFDGNFSTSNPALTYTTVNTTEGSSIISELISCGNWAAEIPMQNSSSPTQDLPESRRS